MRKLTNKQIEEVCVKYKQGISCPNISKIYNVDPHSIWGLLKRRDVPMRSQQEAQRKHFFNEQSFDIITEESAYWIGFLMADGCIITHNTTPEVSLCLHNKDKEHLYKFRSFLESTHSITQVNKDVVKFSIKSKKLADSLMQYGIIPRKSHIAKVSNDLILNKSFWRGVIDGDGSIGEYKSGIMLRLYGSISLLEQFLVFIKTHEPSCNVTVRPHKTIYIISLNGKYAINMIGLLYNECSIALSRKLNAAMIISNRGRGKLNYPYATSISA